jgi:hypothetical protein
MSKRRRRVGVPEQIQELAPEQIQEPVPEQVEEGVPERIHEPIPDPVGDAIPRGPFGEGPIDASLLSRYEQHETTYIWRGEV